MGAACLRFKRPYQSRQSLFASDWLAQTTRDQGTSSRGPRSDCRAGCGAVSQDQRRTQRQSDFADARRDARLAYVRSGHAGRRWLRAAHSLRQRRKPAPRARHITAKGNRYSIGNGRKPLAGRSAVAHREFTAQSDGRSARFVGFGVGHKKFGARHPRRFFQVHSRLA